MIRNITDFFIAQHSLINTIFFTYWRHEEKLTERFDIRYSGICEFLEHSTHTHTLPYVGGARGAMFAVVGNGYGGPRSNLERGCLHFTLC